MRRDIIACASAVFLGTIATSAVAESASVRIRLEVPTHCVVEHRPGGYGATQGKGVVLGQLREFCNAPGGYRLVMNYEPGTLRGATIRVGKEQILLDGSGQAVLSRSAGPRSVNRTVVAAPGNQGFDTDHIEFFLIAA